MTVLRPSAVKRICALTVSLLLATQGCSSNAEEVYGVDVSFPIHHDKVSDNFAWLPHNVDPSKPTPRQYQDKVVNPLPGRQKLYDDFINTCEEAFGKKGLFSSSRCRMTENDRIEMSLRQPQSMQNYTDIGFKKIKAPEKVFKLIKQFWDANKDKEKKENWGVANTYTNNWASPTYMVSVEDSGLRGGGFKLKKEIWNAARDTIGEWTGQELTECSLYGIRVYKSGSILSTHVDRLPLVSSAIINVDADVDEPWPLEVYGHDGKAVNVTMEPGDMVLYESHSVLHGRPFPLKGRYVANVFIHFEPTGHSLRHNAKMEQQDVHAKYRMDTERGFGGHENDNNGLPPYIVPGTPEEQNWRRNHPSGYKQESPGDSFTTGSTPVHYAAQAGDLAALKKHVEKSKDVVHSKDANGWTPLHEASRGGHLDIVRYLLDNGANHSELTGGGESALWWAKQQHGNDHPVVSFLEEIGALDAGPDL